MTNRALDNLSFAAFTARFRVTTEEPVVLPPYTGSAFHGALGRALRRVRYGRKSSCERCPNRPECRYGGLYDYLFKAPADHPFIAGNLELLRRNYANPELRNPRDLPPPYVIEPPPGGEYGLDEHILLRIILVGRAIEFFPFLVCGLEIMAAGKLGKNGRAGLHLEQITANGFSESNDAPLVYDSFSGGIIGPGLVYDMDTVKQWASEAFNDRNSCDRLGIRFITPFKYRKKERIRSDPDFVDLLRTILRRIIFVSVHSPLTAPIDQEHLLELAGQIKAEGGRLRMGYITRYSGREKKRTRLYGAMGDDLIFTGNLTPFLVYLKMGELLHTGKAATFGFGKFTIINPPDSRMIFRPDFRGYPRTDAGML